MLITGSREKIWREKVREREIIDYYTKGLQLHILKDLQEIITRKLLQEKSLPNVSLHKSE